MGRGVHAESHKVSLVPTKAIVAREEGNSEIQWSLEYLIGNFGWKALCIVVEHRGIH